MRGISTHCNEMLNLKTYNITTVLQLCPSCFSSGSHLVCKIKLSSVYFNEFSLTGGQAMSQSLPDQSSHMTLEVHFVFLALSLHYT